MSSDESDTEREPTEYLRNNRTFLKGYKFQFEGIETELKPFFVHVVKDLGGKVGKNAKYILSTEDYFNLPRNRTRANLYSIGFLDDSIQEEQLLEIEEYRFYKNPSNERQSKESREVRDENSSPAKNQRYSNNSIMNTSHITSKRSFAQMLDAGDQNSNSVKDSPPVIIMVSSDSEEEHQTQSTSNKKIKTEVLSLSSHHEEEEDKTVNNRKKINTSFDQDKGSEPGSSSNQKKQDWQGNATKSIFDDMVKIIEDNVKEVEDDSSSVSNSNENVEDDSSGVSNPNEKVEDDSSGVSNSNEKVEDDSPRTSNSNEKIKDISSSVSSSNEEDEDMFRKEWWTSHPIPEREKCKVRHCTFEPVEHARHNPVTRLLSQTEKRIMLKYLISKKDIMRARSLKIYQNMVQEGYLAHRSAETLRNCFRRTVLSDIDLFRLPQDIKYFFNCLKNSEND